MSQFNRPLLPWFYDEAHQSQVIDSANDNNIVAGKGITLTKTTFGTKISAIQQGNQSALNHRGLYNFSASYQINDVVFVDPNIPVLDENGNVIPLSAPSGSAVIPICAGLFVCCRPVPAIGYDSTYLLDAIAPAYIAQGQQITTDFADGFRHYDLNVYFPIFPLLGIYSGSVCISSSTQVVTYVTESTWTTVANQTYWLPLAPCFTSSICNTNGTSNTLTTTYLMGIVSGSVFQYQLPVAI